MIGSNVILNEKEFANLLLVMDAISTIIDEEKSLVEITLMDEGILIESEHITTIVHINRQSAK